VGNDAPGNRPGSETCQVLPGARASRNQPVMRRGPWPGASIGCGPARMGRP